MWTWLWQWWPCCRLTNGDYQWVCVSSLSLCLSDNSGAPTFQPPGSKPTLIQADRQWGWQKVRGQCLPHTCWERCTTISPSPSGNCGHPRSSEPLHCRLPPPRQRRLLSKKAASVTSETHCILTVEKEHETPRYRHISHPNIAWNIATRSKNHDNYRVTLAITLPNVINERSVLLIEKPKEKSS